MYRSVIVGILVFGLFVTASIQGTRTFSRKYKAIVNDQAQRLEYLEAELEQARDSLKRNTRPLRQAADGPVFSETSFDGQSMEGVTIISDSNSSQLVTFRSANLVNATLQGGSASFQQACFDQPLMKSAKLTGEGSSFQMSTLVDADLTGTILQGSLQVASF